MMKPLIRTALLSSISLLPLVVSAESPPAPPAEDGSTDKSSLISEKTLTTLTQLLQGRKPDRISPSPIPGFAEVEYGSTVVYVNDQAGFLISGQVIDLKTGKNLTAERKQEIAAKNLEKLSPDDAILFAPKGETKHTITVFTDVDCPYCRKLHNEVPKLNEAGIAVRYLLFPRAPKGAPSYDKAVSVWCAEDRAEALTKAKAGEDIPKANCPNPIEKNVEIGHSFGVSGTPAIVLENGKMIPGYRPADRMIKLIEKNS